MLAVKVPCAGQVSPGWRSLRCIHSTETCRPINARTSPPARGDVTLCGASRLHRIVDSRISGAPASLSFLLFPVAFSSDCHLQPVSSICTIPRILDRSSLWLLCACHHSFSCLVVSTLSVLCTHTHDLFLNTLRIHMCSGLVRHTSFSLVSFCLVTPASHRTFCIVSNHTRQGRCKSAAGSIHQRKRKFVSACCYECDLTV